MDAEDEDDSAMEDFMASSPPAWNMEMDRTPQPPANGHEELDLGDEDGEIQDIPNAHFDVLNTSLPGYAANAPPTPPSSQEQAERAAYALLNSPARDAKPMQKPRWHFGIRSRSPPMEVMLEIYRTLNTLGMQWRRKEGINMPDIGPAPDEDGYPEEVDQAMEQWEREHGEEVVMGKKPPPGKKEAAAQDKAAQGLYLVETRARYGDIMVRMDLQLYRIDNQNYLVDFRNLGYYRAPDARAAGLNGLKDQAIGGVSGPFHFLEMACQLIAELANG
jgi:carbon catabolite-derepressing protein kinase